MRVRTIGFVGGGLEQARSLIERFFGKLGRAGNGAVAGS